MSRRKEDGVPSPEGKVRGGGLLRQVVHLTLGAAYLAGVKKTGEVSGTNPELQDDGIVEEGGSSGVDGQL